MKIEVVKRKTPLNVNLVEQVNVMELVMKTHSGYMIELKDSRNLLKPVRLSTKNFEKVPSTLLSRWVNANFKKKLLELKGLGGKVRICPERADKEISNPMIFGLRDWVDHSGKVTRVTIEDQIGMDSVVDIIRILGYDVLINFDLDKNRVSKFLFTNKGVFKNGF